MTRTRREFLYDGALVFGAAAVMAEAPVLMAAPSPAVTWPIGCFNRPWAQWPFDQTLKSVKAAGYAATGLLTRTKMDPFIGADATPEYLEGLKRAIAASGIAVNMKSVMTFGINNPEQFEHYFKAMADAAAYGAGKGVQVVMKPHGGSSGASGEIIAAMKKVGHPNFRLWYDAGNIIHYTGKDPIEELKPIVEYVTGFCAKDCAELKGDVMIQFGTGKVDFKGVFQVLKSAGFHGPIMVEGCAPGDTPDAVAANARANREFLEKVLAAV
jgi:sugar phosphate isomerase/epimerase